MKLETDRFIIYYNECDKGYIQYFKNIFESKFDKIKSFFRNDFSDKVIIKLYDSLEEYRENIVQSFDKNYGEGNRMFQPWMIANTEDGNINMQSFSLVRSMVEYNDYSIQDFCLNACHEFVHVCQEKVASDNPGWFWEVLATNLGNPESQHLPSTSYSLNDFNNFDNVDGYGFAYHFGKFLFKHYKDDENEILDMVKDSNLLMKNIPSLIEQAQDEYIKR